MLSKRQKLPIAWIFFGYNATLPHFEPITIISLCPPGNMSRRRKRRRSVGGGDTSSMSAVVEPSLRNLQPFVVVAAVVVAATEPVIEVGHGTKDAAVHPLH